MTFIFGVGGYGNIIDDFVNDEIDEVLLNIFLVMKETILYSTRIKGISNYIL